MLERDSPARTTSCSVASESSSLKGPGTRPNRIHRQSLRRPSTLPSIALLERAPADFRALGDFVFGGSLSFHIDC